MSSFRQNLLLLYILLCPWCTGVITITGVRLAASDLLLPFAAICIALSIRSHEWGMQQLGLIAYGAIAAVSVIPLVSGSFLAVTLMKVIRLWGILAPALLVTSINIASFPLRRAVRAFFWSGLCSVLFGVIAFFFQWDFGVAIQSYNYGGQYLHRAGGTFLDASSFGHLLSTWYVFSMLFVLPTISGPWRRAVFLVGATLLVGYGLYASVSRAALLHLLVVGVAYIILPSRVGNLRISRFLLPVAVALIGVLSWTSDLWSASFLDSFRFIFERLVKTAQAAMDGSEALDRSGGNRLSGWATAIQLWLANPLLGVGYKALVPSYGIFADNTIVLTLVETGILGCLAFTITGIGFVAGALRNYLDELPFGRGLLLFWLGQMTHSLLVDTITFCGSTTLVLMLATALALAIHSTRTRRMLDQYPGPPSGVATDSLDCAELHPAFGRNSIWVGAPKPGLSQ
jgi:O-antigen ligase